MLELQKVSKTFLNSQQPILKEISLKFNADDFCVILGGNGSGKSTLLKLISGEYRPNQGSVLVNGACASRFNGIRSVVQDVNQGTIPEMTLYENMMLAQLTTKKSRLILYRRYQKNILNQLSELNPHLTQYLHTPLGCLSGGQRQFIATLMAIQSNPRVLLLDEHTSALDPKMQAELMKYTSEMITTKKLLALMVTHRLEDALRYGNRLIVLHKGEILLDVSGEEKQALTYETLLQFFNAKMRDDHEL